MPMRPYSKTPIPPRPLLNGDPPPLPPLPRCRAEKAADRDYRGRMAGAKLGSSKITNPPPPFPHAPLVGLQTHCVQTATPVFLGESSNRAKECLPSGSKPDFLANAPCRHWGMEARQAGRKQTLAALLRDIFPSGLDPGVPPLPPARPFTRMRTSAPGTPPQPGGARISPKGSLQELREAAFAPFHFEVSHLQSTLFRGRSFVGVALLVSSNSGARCVSDMGLLSSIEGA